MRDINQQKLNKVQTPSLVYGMDCECYEKFVINVWAYILTPKRSWRISSHSDNYDDYIIGQCLYVNIVVSRTRHLQRSGVLF